MKAEDLRIGNWVKAVIDGKPVKVDWLVIKHMWDGNYQSIYTPNMKVYDPIPITEEVLRKAGLEESIHEDWPQPDFFTLHGITLWNFNGEYWVCQLLDENGIEMPIKHLHQLQNLYYALVGQELRVDW